MKLIILVRNPVDRAYSAYRQQVQRGREHLSFSQAISREKERIRGTIKKMKRNRYKLFYRRRYFSYLDRGKYMKYIRKWQQWFPDTQLLVIKAERLFERTNEVFQEVLDFLQLDRSELVNVQSFNAYDYPPLDLDVREKLRSYFRPYNRELKRQFGISFQEQ